MLAAPLLVGACASMFRRVHALPDCPSGTEMAETQHGQGVGCYRDGAPDGPFVFFDEHGNVASQAQFKNGKLEGRTTFYYPDGHVKFTTAMRAGNMQGRLVVYRDDGSIRKIATHRQGVLDGPYEERRADGAPVVRGTFSRGLKQGRWTYWSARGARPRTFEFDRGRAAVPLLEIRRLPDDGGAPVAADVGRAPATPEAGTPVDAGGDADLPRGARKP